MMNLYDLKNFITEPTYLSMWHCISCNRLFRSSDVMHCEASDGHSLISAVLKENLPPREITYDNRSFKEFH
jgi:hypothetical protein